MRQLGKEVDVWIVATETSAALDFVTGAVLATARADVEIVNATLFASWQPSKSSPENKCVSRQTFQTTPR
jgi:hypothetical protein